MWGGLKQDVKKGEVRGQKTRNLEEENSGGKRGRSSGKIYGRYCGKSYWEGRTKGVLERANLRKFQRQKVYLKGQT